MFLHEDLFKVRIGDNDLECVKHMKYLGVVIHQQKFNKNLEMLQKKIYKKINCIQRLSSKLSKYSKITLYKAIILPHLDYCFSILFLANNSELRYLLPATKSDDADYPQIQIRHTNKKHAGNTKLFVCKADSNLQHNGDALRNGKKSAS
jgi:hypothetical protein